MSGVAGPKNGLTRRSFLKTTAAVAGAATIAGGAGVSLAAATGKQDDAEEVHYSGICRANCTGQCLLDITVRDGKVVQTAVGKHPNPEYDRICSKGLSHLQRLYGPRRIQYPMRRVGERGSGEWERISWDEAIDEICEKWTDIRNKYGDAAIAFSRGTGNYGKAFETSYLLQSLLNSSRIHYNYDNTGNVVISRCMGFGASFAGNSARDIANARNIIVWGDSLAESAVQEYHFYAEAKRKGAKITVIDPAFTIMASKSDRYIGIRPCTDAAFLLAMTNVVIERGWTNVDFVKNSTSGPFLVNVKTKKLLHMSKFGIEPTAGAVDFTTGMPAIEDAIAVWDKAVDAPVSYKEAVDPAIEGSFEIDGEVYAPAFEALKKAAAEWPLEKAAEVCRVAPEVIEELTDEYVHEPQSLITCGYGPGNYCGGHHFYHALVGLLSVTGNIGHPGSGLAGAVSYNVFAPINNPNMVVSNPNLGPTIPAVKLHEVVTTGKLLGKPFDLKSLYIYIHNPLANQPDRQKWLEIIQKMEFVVVAEIEETDTTRYADLVLPICHHFETEDMSAAVTPFLKWQDKAIEPLYESKTDYEVFQLIAKGMGVGEGIPWTYEQYMEDYFDNDMARSMGITLEGLRKQKVFDPFFGADYINGVGGKFSTMTGRMEFYNENPSRSPFWEGVQVGEEIDPETEYVPCWEPPNEAWDELPIHDKYPIIITGRRSRMRTHTQFYDCDWLRELYSEPTLHISTADAEARGIESGDDIKVFNDRGYAIMKAAVDAAVQPGFSYFAKGWTCFDYKEGHCSDLTSCATHPAMYNTNVFDAVCEVEKC